LVRFRVRHRAGFRVMGYGLGLVSPFVQASELARGEYLLPYLSPLLRVRIRIRVKARVRARVR